jgi:hypothetical protein
MKFSGKKPSDDHNRESGMARVILWRHYPGEESEPLSSEAFYDFQRPLQILESSQWDSRLDAEYAGGFFFLTDPLALSFS